MILTINTDDIEMPKQMFGIEVDKLVHFSLFFPYSIMAWLAFNKSITKRFHNWSFLIIAVSGFLLAVFTEFAQSFNPNRNYDPYDMLANFIAILAGSLVIIIITVLNKYFRNVFFRK
ncbi:MAG: VanZ family protein [Rikenellaceae bacterium]